MQFKLGTLLSYKLFRRTEEPCDRRCSRRESLVITVTCGPTGRSVVRDCDVTGEDYYCDLLNYSFMEKLNTLSRKENFELT